MWGSALFQSARRLHPVGMYQQEGCCGLGVLLGHCLKDVIVGGQLIENDSERPHLTVENLGTAVGNVFFLPGDRKVL